MNKKQLYESIMKNVSHEVKKALNEISSETYRKAAQIEDERRQNPDYLKNISAYKYMQTQGRATKFRNYAKSIELKNKLAKLSDNQDKDLELDGYEFIDGCYLKQKRGYDEYYATLLSKNDIKEIQNLYKKYGFTYATKLAYYDTEIHWYELVYNITLIDDDNIILHCVNSTVYDKLQYKKIGNTRHEVKDPILNANIEISDFKYNEKDSTYTIKISLKKNLPIIQKNFNDKKLYILNINEIDCEDDETLIECEGIYGFDYPGYFYHNTEELYELLKKKGITNNDNIPVAYAIYDYGVDGANMQEIHSEKDIKNKADHIYIIFEDKDLAEELLGEVKQVGLAYSGDSNNRPAYEQRHISDAICHMYDFINKNDNVFIYK